MSSVDEMQARPPRVSVGVPVYNGEAYLAQTIESLLAQDFRDIEIVISDNGSTDRTREICEAFALKDPRIRYFRSDVNRGATWNFNRVFELSRGEFFKWQSYDDLVEPAFVGACLRAHEAAGGCAVLVYPRARTIGEKGEPLPGFVERSVDARQPQAYRRAAHVLKNLTLASASYGLIRASDLRKTRLLGRFAAADYVLLTEIAMLGEIHEIPEVLFLRRVHPKISTYTNRSTAELLQWFDTSARARRFVVPTWLWLGVELARAAQHSPLGALDRLRCAGSTIGVWYWGKFRDFAGKHRRRLVDALRPRNVRAR